jgi:hypothetical protein
MKQSTNGNREKHDAGECSLAFCVLDAIVQRLLPLGSLQPLQRRPI